MTNTDTLIPDWDTQELIRRAGGPTGIRRIAEKMGLKSPTLPQIYMWKNRNSIPAPWVATLLLIADHRGEVTAPRQVLTNIDQDPTAVEIDHDPFA